MQFMLYPSQSVKFKIGDELISIFYFSLACAVIFFAYIGVK